MKTNQTGVLKSRLNGASKIHSINIYAIFIIILTRKITDWTAKEISEFDRKIRNLFTVHNVLLLKADAGVGLYTQQTLMIHEDKRCYWRRGHWPC